MCVLLCKVYVEGCMLCCLVLCLCVWKGRADGEVGDAYVAVYLYVLCLCVNGDGQGEQKDEKRKKKFTKEGREKQCSLFSLFSSLAVMV